jgi:hypothetical protein
MEIGNLCRLANAGEDAKEIIFQIHGIEESGALVQIVPIVSRLEDFGKPALIVHSNELELIPASRTPAQEMAHFWRSILY